MYGLAGLTLEVMLWLGGRITPLNRSFCGSKAAMEAVGLNVYACKRVASREPLKLGVWCCPKQL